MLLDSYGDAGLNEVGTFILRSGVVHSLRMRLRAQEWVRRHPEIADEVIAAPVVVVGMMRSGTTLVQRLLAADDRLHCAYGWEVQQVAPRLDWDPTAGGPADRSAPSPARSRPRSTRRTCSPSTRCTRARPRRRSSSSPTRSSRTSPSPGADVATYREWLDTADFAPAYDHLHRMLQLLQWQKRQRGETARTGRAVGAQDAGAPRLPRRPPPDLPRPARRAPAPRPARDDPVRRQPQLDPARDARRHRRPPPHRPQWLARMGWTNDRAMATRDRWEAAGRRR